jgi:hypothetical protein
LFEVAIQPNGYISQQHLAMGQHGAAAPAAPAAAAAAAAAALTPNATAWFCTCHEWYLTQDSRQTHQTSEGGHLIVLTDALLRCWCHPLGQRGICMPTPGIVLAAHQVSTL